MRSFCPSGIGASGSSQLVGDTASSIMAAVISKTKKQTLLALHVFSYYINPEAWVIVFTSNKMMIWVVWGLHVPSPDQYKLNILRLTRCSPWRLAGVAMQGSDRCPSGGPCTAESQLGLC